MTTIQHHVVTQTHSTSNQLDNHLDALLDDLQTSVSRPGGSSMALASQNGPLVNGSGFGGSINLPPGATGYREITTTVTRDTNGVPTTSREYQIEYLNPANSVTVLDDRSSSPAVDLLKSGNMSGHQVQSYKTEVYDYKFSKTTSDRKATNYGGGADDGRPLKIEAAKPSSYQDEPAMLQGSSQYSRSEKSETMDNYRGETNVSKNLNELDMLLKELNNSPGDAMTTPRKEHVQTIETRMEKSSGRYPDSPSTMPKRSASATREMTYTERSQSRSNRAESPMIPSGTPKAPARTINVQREYNTMESRSTSSRRESPSARNRSMEMSPTLRRRTPSPSGEFRPANFSNYPINPRDLTPTRSVSTKTYTNYSSTGRRTPTPTTFDEPQPYRSPSPVSFPQKRSPSPVRKSLSRTDSGRTVSYQVSPPMQENPTVITYKYSSHSREQSRYPGGTYEAEPPTRPFPTSTPVPTGEQSPPKKLDELMASFQDSSRSNTMQEGHFPQKGEYVHQVEYSRESRERHGDLQRSPSFERNLRPSNVKVTQSYSQQQQQSQEYQQSQYQQHREQYQQSHQQQYHQQPGSGSESYRREFRREEHHTREQPGQYQQREQYQQNQGGYQKEQYQQSQGGYQREHREQYQQSQGGYQREHREQYQQNQGQYQQNQQYQYQQNQQYQQNSSQMQSNEAMANHQAYRAASASRSVAGPPVYYPPGVELFTKKEEAMLMEQSGGKSKGKSKSKSSEKGKDKGKGVTGVPMCLPVCCAMPCSIM